MSDPNQFETSLKWPATSRGTDATTAAHPAPEYSRDSELAAPAKPVVAASAPAQHGGNTARYNPEELMMLSLSQCHMLTFLAIASKKRIPVLAYVDHATGTLGLGVGTPGKMSMHEVVLRPLVTIAKGFDLADLPAIHEKAHANCFMSNSVNFPVRIEAAGRLGD